LDNGANIDLKDARGDTPLSLAAVAGQPDIVEILLEYGASTDVRNREGRTPLQAVINFKKILSSNAIMDKTSQSLKKRLDECAEILKKHEDK
jgi:ankyrin repeat protein